ncbi:MAG: hypothetical protein KIC73_01115 [Clostridiales bacterium]|nr:hypothetical protein [Clostridiales bacterium]
MSDKKYCIQLAECDGNSKDVYSYDEIEIGTWVDGKPIYRKVIPGKLAKNSGNIITFANVSDLKIDRVINLYGNAVDEVYKGQITLQMSFNRTDGLEAAVNMYYDTPSANILYHFLNNGGSLSGIAANVIIEYTKK